MSARPLPACRAIAVAAATVAAPFFTPPQATGAPIVFNKDIRPILSDACFACHGFDAKKRKGELRLDMPTGPDGACVPNKEGRVAVKAGDPAGSELWKRLITEDADDVMPPTESHKVLKPEQKEMLRRWIEEGARYQRHWSFEAPVKAEPPLGASTGGAGPIDAFLADKLGKEGLAFSGPAEKETLLRRVTFALTGLPPTPTEVDAFLADNSPDAYAKVVDRLLSSPRYGEQMGRHWLDVARYGDTHGLHLDNERSMWPYRDWVVGAFNRNLSFDRFTIEQIGGDLLPNATPEQIAATGFSRCNVTTSEGGSIDAEFTFRYAVDRTATMVQAWMGLNGGCVVCHDSKFDPITMRDFYSLYSFFYTSADPAMDGNVKLTAPTVQLKSPEQEKQIAALGERLKSAEAQLAASGEAVVYTDPATITPLPGPQTVEYTWLDDDPPAGANFQSSGPATDWVPVSTAGARVLSGKRALRRRASGQDFYEGGAEPLTVPPEAKIFAHVFLEPNDLPRTLMLQYHKGGWLHRAVWGDYEGIDWGAKGTTERVNMGPLPEAGKWVKLEFPAEKLGFTAGDKITGLAFTMLGGTVWWDKAGVTGRSDPAADPERSLTAWLAAQQKAPSKDLPGDLQSLVKKPADKLSEADRKALRAWFLTRVCLDTKPRMAPFADAVNAAKKALDDYTGGLPQTLVMRDLPKPRQANIMVRGQYDKPGEPVEPNTPAIFPVLKKAPDKSRADRLDLARWLVSPEHPLTARVTVNRFWQQFFGTGLVKTSADFGSQGEPPSHPELLDWLAVDFRENGWDVKRLVRQIVTSRAWTQSSHVTPALWQKDPENRLLARGPRLRLDAEELRDNALFVGGLLDETMGGPGVKPYQPPNIWEPVGFVGSNTANYKQDTGSALYRRSLYVFLKRTAPPPFMSNFDAPSREQFCARRERSNTPLQALQLMNDVQHVEAARGLAQRLIKSGGATPSERIAAAFRTVLGRVPAAEETVIVQDAFAQHLNRYRKAPDDAKKLVSSGESKPDASLDPVELAAWTMIANLVLNMDETITRN